MVLKKQYVLGVDLSLAATGYVILGPDGIYESELIKTSPTENPTEETERLIKIVNSIPVTVKQEKVRLVAIEGLAISPKGLTRSLTQLSGLNYMFRSRLLQQSIPFLIVAPTSLKKFVTGQGNVPKDIMMLETFKRWGVTLTDNNLCDAHGLAQVAAHFLGITKETLLKPHKEVIKLMEKQHERRSIKSN